MSGTLVLSHSPIPFPPPRSPWSLLGKPLDFFEFPGSCRWVGRSAKTSITHVTLLQHAHTGDIIESI